MKKIIAFTVAAAAAFTLVSCGEELQKSAFADKAEALNVVMSPQFSAYSPDFERVQFTLTNNTDGMIEFGAMYGLEVKSGDEWRSIPFAENTGFNALLYTLEAGGSHSFGVSSRMFDYDFKAGSYRVVKEIGGEYVSAEFEIADGGMGKDNPYGYYDISTLPDNYSPEDALSDGCINADDVTSDGGVLINRFIKDYLNGMNTELRYFRVTDGGIVIYDVLFERPSLDRIKLTEDATRAGGAVSVSYYSGIVTDGERLFISNSCAYDENAAVSFMDGVVWEGIGDAVAELSKKNGAELEWMGSEVFVWSPDGMRNVQYGGEEKLDFGITVLYEDGGNSGCMNTLPAKLADGTALLGIESAEWKDVRTVAFCVETPAGFAEVLYDTDSYKVIE